MSASSLTDAIAQESGDLILCETCATDITHLYKGKGRKPKYCEEHNGSAKAKPAAANVPRGNVGQAVNSLEQIYNLLQMALMLAQAHNAAALLGATIPDLQAKNAIYLEKDPELVKTINSWGAKGGRTAFFATQAFALVPVGAAAAMELRANAEARKAAAQALAEEVSDGIGEN